MTVSAIRHWFTRALFAVAAAGAAAAEHFCNGRAGTRFDAALDGDPLLLAGRRSQRGVTDRFENEGLAFQLKVRQGFVELSKAYPQRIRVIDALQEQESVRGCLISELEALLKG